ncbi:MAG: hypothetical protein MN733_30330 [Nitrososphaera sp.]|nr:hypothetical protein [Nitrososphaera sp.]
MQKGRPRKFRDPTILQQMLQDYINSGLSLVALGRKYGCDHTSILYLVKKYGVKRGVPTQISVPQKPVEPPKHVFFRPATPPPKVHKYDHIINEPINPGKSYAEYLAEYERRRRQMTSTTSVLQ